MNNKILVYGLSGAQQSVLSATLPEQYEMVVPDCVTDLITSNPICSIIDSANMSKDSLRVLLAYYMDVGDRLDETVVWLGNIEVPDLPSFVYCDSFLDLLTELDSIFSRAKARHDTMQMYDAEYGYLPKHAIEEAMEADIQTQLHHKFGEHPDPIVMERLRKELTALREVDGFPDLAAAYELSRWLKAKNIPFFVEYVTASGLIPYLLGITLTNPLPPHAFCPICKKGHWEFDVPVCTTCGTALIKDGYNLVWQEYAGYGRIPTYGFWLPASAQKSINDWLENHWLKSARKEIWGSAKIDKCRIDAGPFYFVFVQDEGQLVHAPSAPQASIVLPDQIYREDVYH